MGREETAKTRGRGVKYHQAPAIQPHYLGRAVFGSISGRVSRSGGRMPDWARMRLYRIRDSEPYGEAVLVSRLDFHLASSLLQY